HTPSSPARKRSSGPRDLLVVGLVVAAVFGLGLAFDLFDLVGDLIVDWVYLDEFVALALMLVVGLSIVALRRSAQATRERALRQDTEATAARTEARFRTIVERVPAVAYVWDSAEEAGSAPALYISPQLESLLGYTAEEWLADPQAHARTIHPDDADRVYSAWAEAVKDGDVFATEYRLQRADGRWVWIRDEANPVGKGPSGHQIYQGVLFDITERREAEQRLRDLEHRWRTLLESLPVTAFTIEYDLDAPDEVHSWWVAPGVVRLVGVTPEEWVADRSSWAAHLHPDDRERAAAEWAAAIASGEPRDTEYRLMHQDGHPVWVREQTAVAVRDGRLRADGVFIDVTAQREAEAALGQAEARYQSLVEQLPVAVYTDAVDDVSTALYISPRYEQLTGYTPQQRLEDPELWVRMLHPDDRAHVLEESERTNRTGEPFDVEYRIVSSAGEMVWLHDHAVLVMGADGRRVWQGVLQDVTERRLAQEALSRRDAILQSAGFAAERLLGSSSWEEALPAVLARLGAASEASRAYLYRNDEVEDEHTASLVDEWHAPGSWERELDELLPAFAWSDSGFDRWTSILGKAQVLHGPVSTFPEAERAALVRSGIRTLLAIPIFVRDLWWGYVGFDDLDNERAWHEAEIDALAVTANTLGAAIARQLDARELSETQRRYQTLVEHIPAVTYIDDVQLGQIVYASPQMVDLLGYSAEEWNARWPGMLHPDDRERVLEEERRTGATGEDFHVQYRVVKKNGETVWIGDEAILVRGDDGTPMYWQGVMFDLTETKAAEARLREAEERYRGIVEHVPAAIYVDRADRSMETIYVSPQIEDIVGVTPDEWMADPELWISLMHPEDRDSVVGGYLHAADAAVAWSAEYRLRTKDGRTIWVHDETTFLHDEHGAPSFMQGVIYDVTERKLAEQALRESEQRERDAAERLRAIDEMKNTFLAAVSHELRSPLTSILGLSLTLERTPSLTVEDRDDLLQRLATNARKLDRLLKDLLDIDRLNRGIMEPQLRPTDVGALVRRTIESLDQLAGREIVSHAESVVIAIDPPKVERIVENLVLNAARHTPSDRRIWVRVEPVDDGVLISVDDDGPGVPPELRGEIFEPFRQGPTASPHAPGTGIGLSLVGRFAEMHGGRAWVTDREGGGASFRVFLPGHPGLPTPGLAGGPVALPHADVR
ncbi:MAG: PAS domain-containing protein, partial [Actinomycetota bacterium]